MPYYLATSKFKGCSHGRVKQVQPDRDTGFLLIRVCFAIALPSEWPPDAFRGFVMLGEGCFVQ